MQRQGPLKISHKQEDKNNGAYGSRFHGSHKLDKDDIVRNGWLLDTPYRIGDRKRYHSNSDSNRHNDRYCYHPYRRSDRGYFPNEFKKENPPTFDGEVMKS